jgi:hypothetical protein
MPFSLNDIHTVGDGNLVTAGGVMSGIEMSLWLGGEALWGGSRCQGEGIHRLRLPAEASGRGGIAANSAGRSISAERRQRAAPAGYRGYHPSPALNPFAHGLAADADWNCPQNW